MHIDCDEKNLDFKERTQGTHRILFVHVKTTYFQSVEKVESWYTYVLMSKNLEEFFVQ